MVDKLVNHFLEDVPSRRWLMRQVMLPVLNRQSHIRGFAGVGAATFAISSYSARGSAVQCRCTDRGNDNVFALAREK